MEEHHLQVWSPTCHNIEQWKAIQQSQVSKNFPRLRSRSEERRVGKECLE